MYTPILATLGFIMSPDGLRTLLVHRNQRSNDPHLGKYNGLGGKVEPDEDIFTCLRREIFEESGLQCQNVQLRGTISWPGFGEKGEAWFGFLFRIDSFTGVPFSSNAEGDLSWQRIDQLRSLPMWEGDRFFLPMIFDDNPIPFHGIMPYKNGQPLSWSFVRGV